MSTEDIIEKVADLVTVPEALAPDIQAEVDAAMAAIDGTEQALAEPEAVAESVVEEAKEDISAVVAAVRTWIPTTGPDIKAFLAAAEHGMENIYAATRDEVHAFVTRLT